MIIGRNIYFFDSKSLHVPETLPKGRSSNRPRPNLTSRDSGCRHERLYRGNREKRELGYVWNTRKIRTLQILLFSLVREGTFRLCLHSKPPQSPTDENERHRRTSSGCPHSENYEVFRLETTLKRWTSTERDVPGPRE